MIISFLRTFSLLAWCIVCWSLCTGTANADDAQRSGRKLFTRGALGVGYVGLESDPDKRDLSIGHVGMYWDLAAGATVWRDLSVHGTFFGGWAWEPDVKENGQNIPGQHGSQKSLSVVGVGPGLTYHFQPLNLYLSYSIGCGWSILQFHNNRPGDVPGWSNFGFANEVLLGKEWWVGKGMAVGGAVQALFAHVKGTDGELYNSFGGSLMLSASYR